MADISKITLPSGNTYEIKDAYARQLLAGGISFVVCWDGTSVPVVADIPKGVVVTYNGTTYTGTKEASTAEPLTFYLVNSPTQEGEKDVYDEYVAIDKTGGTKDWEKLGDTRIDLSDLGALAYKDNVILNKGNGKNVLGESATFTTTVTPATTNIKATASGTAVTTTPSDSFVKSYPGSTNKLVTTSVPNVTSAGTAPTWNFALGTGADAETLIISGNNGSATTLGTAITCATGALAANGGGGSVMVGLGTPSTGTAVGGVSVSTQPTVELSTGASAGTGVISVATGISSASTTTNSKDSTKVALYDDLSVSVS